MNDHKQHLSNHHADEGSSLSAPEDSSEPLPNLYLLFPHLEITTMLISIASISLIFLSSFTTSACIPKQYSLVLPNWLESI